MLMLLFTTILAENDCDWVKIIYEKMGGDVSKIPQENCCEKFEMFGISCHDGHIIQIRWGYLNLDGYIPPEIGNLVHLKSL